MEYNYNDIIDNINNEKKNKIIINDQSESESENEGSHESVSENDEGSGENGSESKNKNDEGVKKQKEENKQNKSMTNEENPLNFDKNISNVLNHKQKDKGNGLNQGLKTPKKVELGSKGPFPHKNIIPIAYIQPMIMQIKEKEYDRNFIIDINNINSGIYINIFNAYANVVVYPALNSDVCFIKYTDTKTYFEDSKTECELFGSFLICNFKKEYLTLTHKLKKFKVFVDPGRQGRKGTQIIGYKKIYIDQILNICSLVSKNLLLRYKNNQFIQGINH
jgi:hypothetical protein